MAERDPRDRPIIRLPKRESVLATQSTILIKELLGFSDGDIFSKVEQIIFQKAIDIYGETK